MGLSGVCSYSQITAASAHTVCSCVIGSYSKPTVRSRSIVSLPVTLGGTRNTPRPYGQRSRLSSASEWIWQPHPLWYENTQNLTQLLYSTDNSLGFGLRTTFYAWPPQLCHRRNAIILCAILAWSTHSEQVLSCQCQRAYEQVWLSTFHETF